MKNKGDYSIHNKSYNTLVINIVEQKHEEFERKGIDLYTNRDINLNDALCGCIYPLEFLNGNIINLNINKIIKPDTLIKVKGYGLPYYNKKIINIIMESNY